MITAPFAFPGYGIEAKGAAFYKAALPCRGREKRLYAAIPAFSPWLFA